MALNPSALEFAYKYPFSIEAKEIVKSQEERIEIRYLDMGGSHVQDATGMGFQYSRISITSVMLDYLMTYLYSRMLLSAVRRSDIIKMYALAEAKRSAEALLSSGSEDIARVAEQLNIKVGRSFGSIKSTNNEDEFTMGFVDYVKNAPAIPVFELVNQRLSSGAVLLDKNKTARVFEQAMVKEIMKGLPINSAMLPKEVVSYSKRLRFSVAPKAEITKGKGREEWIEKLLERPIADVRHRTVNLILAPYLVNTKGLEVGQATKIIVDYIERCKLIDPNTRINERYIEYQCNYSKTKGLRPLSIDRAKELLGDIVG